MVLYRLGRYLHSRGLRRFALLISRFNRLLFGVWLPSSANIGRGTRLGYWGLGIVIHSEVSIGRNCLIAQNVTIGRNLGDRGVPLLGDNVYVGAGSVVFGQIHVGNGCIIGANSVVNHSVEEGDIVAGNPARVIGKTHARPYWILDLDSDHQCVDKV